MDTHPGPCDYLLMKAADAPATSRCCGCRGPLLSFGGVLQLFDKLPLNVILEVLAFEERLTCSLLLWLNVPVCDDSPSC